MAEIGKRPRKHRSTDNIQLTTLSTDKLTIDLGLLMSDNSHPIRGQTRVDVQDQLVFKPP